MPAANVRRSGTGSPEPTPRPTPIRYIDSPRHALEVEHFSYRKQLERLVTALDRRIRTSMRHQAHDA